MPRRRAQERSGRERTVEAAANDQTSSIVPSDVTSRPSALIIGSEALPFSKTGGLADVLGALPPALAQFGWDVTLVLPRYREGRKGTLIHRFDLRIGGVTANI